METLHVTGLEKYMKCPYNYKNIEWNLDDRHIVNTYFGEVVHMLHRDYDMWMQMANFFTQTLLPEVLWYKDNIILDQLKKIWQHAIDFQKKVKKHNPSYEVKLAKYVDDIYIVWTFDCFTTENWGTIYDFKTATDQKMYENWEDKWQPIIYSYLLMTMNWLKEIDFVYLVYKKLKTPKVFEFKKRFTLEQVKEKFEYALEQYKTSQDSGFYLPNENSWCGFCPLRTHKRAKAIWMEKCILYLNK